MGTAAWTLRVSCLLLLSAAVLGVRPSSGLLHLPGQTEVETDGKHWALLVAGSAGWGNYRHQADICHAYQILRQGGLSDENIIVMMADDLAKSPLNPHPGQVFNKPGGRDVYSGVPRDYVGSNVTAQNVLKVLAGNSSAMNGIGSGRVIASGPSDTVFFYFADHGAPGILGMPFGPFLYASDFVSTLVNKSNSNGFAKMVVYIEACESGSIFKGMPLNDTRIFATTAANAVESSWGTYCPGMSPAPPSEFDTCLGDLYSVAWLEDTETHSRMETLQDQFKQVRERVSKHGTYMQGSHVLEFGDMSIATDPVGLYIGFGNITATPRKEFHSVRRSELLEQATELQPVQTMDVPQRDAELMYMTSRYMSATDPAERVQYFKELSEFTSRRNFIVYAMNTAVELVLQDPLVFATVLSTMPTQIMTSLSAGGSVDIEALSDDLIFGNAGRSDTLQVVDDWDCLKGTIQAYEVQCGQLGQYGMKYSGLIANMCNLGVADAFAATFAEACSI